MATLGDVTLTIDSEIQVAADGSSFLVDGSPFTVEEVFNGMHGQRTNFKLEVCRNMIMAVRASARAPDGIANTLYDRITGNRRLASHLEAQVTAYIDPTDPPAPDRPMRDRAFLFLHQQHQRYLKRYGATLPNPSFAQAAATRKNELRRDIYNYIWTDRAKAFIKAPFPLYVTRQQIPPEILNDAIFIPDTDRFREASRIDPSLAQDILVIQDTANGQGLNSYEITRREELRFKLQLALVGLPSNTIEDWRDSDWARSIRDDTQREADDE